MQLIIASSCIKQKLPELKAEEIANPHSYRDIYLFIYLFLAALGLDCCAQAFSSCSEWGLLFIMVHGLIAVASLVVEHRLLARGL